MTRPSLRAAIGQLLDIESAFDRACDDAANCGAVSEMPSDAGLRDAAETMRLAARHAPNASVDEISAAEGWLQLWDTLETTGPSDPDEYEAALAKLAAVR